MDDLFVKCTVEYLDSTLTEHLNGKLFVDPSEGSFTVTDFKGGKSEEHKFFAKEFTSFANPPNFASAQQFSLRFDLSKQHSAKYQKRRHALVIKIPDRSRKIKDIYDEVKKAFDSKNQRSRHMNTSNASPVGMLRSLPNPSKSRSEHRHRIPKFVFDDPLPNCSGPLSPGPVFKKPPSFVGNKTIHEPKNLSNVPNTSSGIASDSSGKSRGLENAAVQTSEKPSRSSGDVIEIIGVESKRSKTGSKPASSVGSRGSKSVSKSKPATNDIPIVDVDEVAGIVRSPKLKESNDPEPKTADKNQSRTQNSRKSSELEKTSQGSIISLVEQDALNSSHIRVTAPFDKRTTHTFTFKQKRSGRSPTKPTLAKRLASEFSDEPIPNDAMIDLDGLSSSSFYGSQKPVSNRKQMAKSEIISPRPQLLADSISSSRCLMSPPSGSKGFPSTSLHLNREALTPSRKRKEVNDIVSRDFSNDSDVFNNLSSPPAEHQLSPYSYRGLENLTNSCYMNATLQALASVYPFYYRMQMIQQRREDGGECSEFVRRFNDVLHNLVSPDRESDMKYGSATKISVLEALRAAAGRELGTDPDFGSSMQQDAHEFLAKTLEALEKESLRRRRIIKNEKTTDSSPECSLPATSSRNPAGVFQHKIRDRFGCERCARASEMTNDAIDLTVTVSAGESIQKMIENALAREEIEFKCDHCGTGAGFMSRAFATLPQSLIVVVKRYRFGEAGGSKVEERIGVSRELFLKDLFVDSDVKKQEGIARRSLSQSVAPCIREPRENGRSDDSGVSSEVESVASRSEGCPQADHSVSKISNSSADKEMAHKDVSQISHSSGATEQCENARSITDVATISDSTFIDCPSSNFLENPVLPAKSGDFTSQADVTSRTSRLALSPLKMNRPCLARDEKLSDSFGSPRLVIVDDVTMETSEGVVDHLEKENALFSPLKLVPEVEGRVIKQSGGYLKDSPDVGSAGSGNGSTVSHEVADIPNDIGSASTQSDDNVLEKDVNSLKLTDTRDVPSKRARLESTEPEKAKDSTADSSIILEPSTSYARQITEPLRPSSSIISCIRTPTTPSREQISVVGEVEERSTLVFRPVTEERQKAWCERLGFAYVGSLDRRKRMFGREIEFSLRDIPQSCEVRGDGNCLFRTLCWWITGGSEREYVLLRKKLISFMTKYRSKFTSLLMSQQDMDTHLMRMAEDGEWGTQVELAAAACWLNVNIYTFLEGKWLRYRPLFRWKSDGSSPVSMSRNECNDDTGAIFICNASGCHFQPAVSVEPRTVKRNLRPRRDREIVKDPSPLRSTPEPPYVFNVADGPVYSLSAVICHHGDSLLTGHYSTFALDATRQEWLDCNDHIITKVSEAEVIDNSSSSGYIFIYNRVEDPLSRL